MKLNHIRYGNGPPLLLIHGLGGTWRSWQPILDNLAVEREVIAVDLPGFGKTPPLKNEVTISSLSDAVTEFLSVNGLLGVDAVGSSMGARLVLELARRGEILGSVVSLNPGGFWMGWERHCFYGSVALSIRLIRMLDRFMPHITSSKIGRALLLAQFSSRPFQLSPHVVLREMRSYVSSKSFDELLYNLAYGETQQGAPKGSIDKPLVIGWGKNDHVCFPNQATRALDLFPDAKFRWFEDCGHFPHWDAPEETSKLILDVTDASVLNRFDQSEEKELLNI